MSETKTLIKKLVKVMSEVKRVAKNGTNTFQNYDYVTEADILAAVRDGLAQANVFIFSSVENAQRDGDLTSVVMKHTFVDGDSGEEFVVKSMGQGSDKQDKGSNKAITGAMKYFLMKNFLMPTGDDPEATDETGKSTGPKVSAVKSVSTAGAAVADTSVKKTYGFSNRAKTAAPAAVKAVEPEMHTDDSF